MLNMPLLYDSANIFQSIYMTNENTYYYKNTVLGYSYLKYYYRQEEKRKVYIS